MEEKDKVTPEIYEEERSDRVVRLEVHRGGREEPEPMVPLRAVAPLLGYARAQMFQNPDPAFREVYDLAAHALGLPDCKALLSGHSQLQAIIADYERDMFNVLVPGVSRGPLG